MFEMVPIKWLGFVILFQTVLMWLYLRDIGSNLEKILKVLEAE